VGVQPLENLDSYDNTLTMSGSQTPFPVYKPTPNNWLRAIWLQVNVAYPSNAVATLVQNDVGIFGVFAQVTFADSNQKPILQLTGFQLAMLDKWGGFFNVGDPRADATYSNPLTSTPTAAQFNLAIPIEVVSRDAFGTLQNASGDSPFVVTVTLATEASVFSTTPTNAPTVRLRITEDGYTNPVSGVSPTPQAKGSTLYSIVGAYNMNAGAQTPQITQGMGYPVRQMIFINTDTGNGTRATGDTDWPDPQLVQFKGLNMLNRTKTLWKARMSKDYGYTATAADAPMGLDNGVYVLNFNKDFTNAPGDELRNTYLSTKTGDVFALNGSWAGASTMYVLASYLAIPNGNLASIRAGGR
jgi:hypothetical protein